MSPSEALNEAIRLAGSQSELARVCGCTQGAVWQMLRRSEPRLSWQYVLRVEEALGVSRHVLRPDVYPLEQVA